MEKILVTGGAGFIGSHLTDKLIELGYDVTVLDNFSTGNYSNLENAQKSKNFRIIKLDLSSKSAETDLVEITKGIDYVFHLASIPRTQYCVENPIICNFANVNGTINLLAACSKNKIKKFIHSSSCGIYGPQDILPISESASINMGTPYSVQKYMQELYVDLFNKLYKMPAIMLRYFNVYGTKRQTEKGSYPNVLASFSKQKREKGKIFVTGDGEQSRDMVHVYDVVDANITAMYSDLKDAEVFNIGTGKAITINEMTKYFECSIEYIETRPGEAKHLFANITKVEKILKWKPKIFFEEGIKNYLKEIK